MRRPRPSPRKKPRRRVPAQQRAVATVEAILAAAARVFVREGFAGATTNRIAERAGVSIGSLYEYFPNKDTILVALVDRHIADGEAVLAEAVADVATNKVVGFPAIIRRFVEAVVQLHAIDPPLHRVLFEEAPRPPAIRQRLDALEHKMIAATASILVAHTKSTAEVAKEKARTIVRVVDALTHRRIIDDRSTDLESAAFVDDTLRLILGYAVTQ